MSSGTTTGGSLKTYGIDMDSTGKMSFDASAFAAAYAADPTGTQTAVASAFAANLNTSRNGRYRSHDGHDHQPADVVDDAGRRT